MQLRHLFALLSSLACSAAFAQTAADRLEIKDAWVRLNPPGTSVTGAFMQLRNAGDKDVQVVKAESAVAKVTELHNHINEGGVMKMRQVPGIAIKAKAELALKPGSYHVMLIDLKAPLKEGDKVAITLVLDDGSSKKIEAPVTKPASEPHAHKQH